MSLHALYGLPRFYAWGGYEYIRTLMGLPLKGDRPLAEWWMGAHPDAPSVIETDLGPQPLTFALQEAPRFWLGSEMAERFGGTLPFLLKILDVRDILSIQVHPDKAQAEAGFQRENEAGIAQGAASRNYRDANHKPEMAVALGPVWLLHGFRGAEAIAGELRQWPSLAVLGPVLEWGGVEGVFRHVMRLPQEQVDALLRPVSERTRTQADQDDKRFPAYWIRKSDDGRVSGFDRGLFAVLLLNIVRLNPGEGIYQPARLLHAYLEGRMVELMSTSDNVLRAGLTPKHIDVDELLSVVRFVETSPDVVRPVPVSEGIGHYPIPEKGFALDMVTVDGGSSVSFTPDGAEILLVIEGGVRFFCAGKSLEKGAGASLFVTPGHEVHVMAQEGRGVVVRARTPL